MEKYLILTCTRNEFINAAKAGVKLITMDTWIKTNPLFIDKNYDDAIKDCRKFNLKENNMIYYFYKIKEY